MAKTAASFVSPPPAAGAAPAPAAGRPSDVAPGVVGCEGGPPSGRLPRFVRTNTPRPMRPAIRRNETTFPRPVRPGPEGVAGSFIRAMGLVLLKGQENVRRAEGRDNYKPASDSTR